MTAKPIPIETSAVRSAQSLSQAKTLPFVSVVLLCRNEEAHIAQCLDSILANDYPEERMEVLVLDGMSEDRTREIVNEYTRKNSGIRLMDNRPRTIPCGMNLGIDNAIGDIIVKLDAHSKYPQDYISASVRFLFEYEADVVGGVFRIQPRGHTAIARAVALALSHRFGSGNAYAKVGCKEPRWADAVSFGSFRKELFSRIGRWNEKLAGSSDMEFNIRLRRAGGKILLVPSIGVDYYADSDLKSLWRHNFADGVWATYVMKFKSRAWSWRHWIPMGFVASVIGSVALGLFVSHSWCLFAAIIGAYLVGSAAASVQIALRERSAKLLPLLPLTFAVRHLSHGLGALYGLLLLIIPGNHWRGRRTAKA